jgi:hypothetical protein
MAKGESRGAFVVDLGELELSEDAVERITRSIRKSVLAEIASLDEAPGFSVGLRPPKRDEPWFEGIDWIRTRGIWVDIENLPRFG